jgi:hypothetical protein
METLWARVVSVSREVQADQVRVQKHLCSAGLSAKCKELSMSGLRYVECAIDKCVEKCVEMPCCPAVLTANIAVHNRVEVYCESCVYVDCIVEDETFSSESVSAVREPNILV